jgi:DNA invertase Pin-like site-specific DNA recombinase
MVVKAGYQGIVAYLRVSTSKQEASGLGLEAQEAAVLAYSQQVGLPILCRYMEVESGKRNDRTQLLKALAHVKRSRAVLVVAKLDRLSRNAAFLLTLQDSGVPFIACDNPTANELTVGILAVVAQQERKAISQRTKDALQAVKRRGVLLGSARPGHWDGREHKRLAGLKKARVQAVESIQAAAAEAYADLLPMMAKLRDQGASLQAIADDLNGQGHCTRHGKPWNPMQVSRVLARAS